MTPFRLRSQLFTAALLIILGLAGSVLLTLRYAMKAEIQKEVREGTKESIRAFETVQRERELQLSRTAAMLAELPTLKAQMSTAHAPTIQDASESFWKLAGSDLFVLAKPDGEVLALHTTKPGWSSASTQRDLKRSIDLGEDSSWWYEGGRLYWVFLHPIISGAGNTMQQLGFLAVGYQVDSAVAHELAIEAGNQITLTTDEAIIASTLPPPDEAELQSRIVAGTLPLQPASGEMSLKTDQYAFSSVSLRGSPLPPVYCYVLIPLSSFNTFIKDLDNAIYLTGGISVVFGALLFGFVARTITRPLDNLVAGVKALASGDFTYSITPRGAAELVELSSSFARMRGQLLALQQQRIETERVAALARAASSISHDLRHYLAAVVANAEFLYEADKLKLNRDEIYSEIKTASEQMVDLLDSFRELAREEGSITPTPGMLDKIIRRAAEAVLVRPELRSRGLRITTSGSMDGVFDQTKIERVF